MEQLMSPEFYRSLCSTVTLQSKKEGFFKDFASYVKEESGSDLLDRFSCLKSDDARFEFCWNLPAAHSLSLRPIYKEKSDCDAEKKRELGNAAFQKKEYGKALLFYSQSIIRASYRNGPQRSSDRSNATLLPTAQYNHLALGLANRSAALFYLGEYTDCLNDIHLSLKENYPESLQYKLYERMGKCYKILGETAKAKVAFSVAQKLVEKSDMDEAKRKKKISELDDCAADEKAVVDSKKTKSNTQLPTPTGNSVAVETTDSKGRQAVAAQQIQTGDILVVEEPYVACLLPEKFGTHCHHCFKRFWAPVGCFWCSGLAFCSTKCRDSACDTYHKHECPILDLLIGSGMSILCHLAIRLFTQRGLQFFLQLKEPLIYDPCNTSSAALLKDEVERFRAVYNLVTLADKRSPEDMLDRTLMAVFLIQCMQISGYLTENSDVSGKTNFLGSILLHFLQILQFNAHEVHEYQMNTAGVLRESKTLYIGVALYPTVSFFNHGCYPAVTRYFVGKHIVIRALRSLQPGEVIAENYGPIFTHKQRRDRMNSLRSRYWFDCACAACVEDWPTFDTMTNSITAFRCSKCQARIVASPKTTGSVSCEKCSSKLHVAQTVKEIQAAETLYKKGMDFMEKGRIEQAVWVLCQYVDVLETHLYPPCRDLHLSQEALRLCFASQGSVHFRNQDKLK